jgi:hypothetical protein
MVCNRRFQNIDIITAHEAGCKRITKTMCRGYYGDFQQKVPHWQRCYSSRTAISGKSSDASMVVLFGLVLNRFNVSMFGLIQKDQQIYYPSFFESVVTIGIIAAHILFFALIARYFPIFEHYPEEVDNTIPDCFHRIDKQPAAEKSI